ncbi:MAG: hypothetical protein ACTSYI_09240, partial [Promethearchaeota archaeon]
NSIIPFYLRLGWIWVKKSYLIILSVSLTLSMIFATNFVIEGGLAATYIESFKNAEDFIICSPQSSFPNSTSISNEIYNYEHHMDEIKEREGGEYENLESFPYLNFRMKWNNFGLREHSIAFFDYGYANYLESRINFLLFSEKYYNSIRFTAQFKVVEGRTPQSTNEVLVPYIYKTYYNYNLNDPFDLTYFIGEWSEQPYITSEENSSVEVNITGSDAIYQSVQLNNTKIVGFYTSVLRLLDFLDDTMQSEFMYQDFLDGGASYKDFWSDTPVFFYSNFSANNLYQSPIMQLYDSIIQNSTLFTVVNQQLPSLFRRVNNIIHFGVTVSAKLEKANYNQIIAYRNQLQEFRNVLEEEFSSAYFYSTYENALEELSALQFLNRFLSLIINLPLILFTFFIALSGMKTIRKSRLESILQMNIKGMTKPQIRIQMYIEIFLIGTISNIIGMLLGFIFFYPIRSTLSPLFFSGLDPTHVSIIIQPFWIITTYLIGFVVVSIAYRFLFKILKTTEIPDIFDMQNQQSLPAQYDEDSVYKDKHDDSKLAEFQSKNYEDSIQNAERKIPKISYFLMPVIFIPIILYGITSYSISHEIGSFWEQLAYSMSYNQNAFLIFGLFIPICTSAYGFYRFVIVESPRMFAKICKYLSRPLNKEINYLVGLEMVRRKEFRYIILLLTFFITSVVFFNPLTTSLNSYPILFENSEIGVDFSIDIEFNDSIIHDIEYYTQFSNKFEANFNEGNISLTEYTEIITQFSDLYYINEPFDRVTRHIHYANFTAYRNILDSQKNLLPNQELLKSLDESIDQNEDVSSSKIGIIVGANYNYYDDIEEFDSFFVNLTYYDHNDDELQSKWLECEIVARTDYFPGIYSKFTGLGNSWDFFIDIGSALPENSTIVSNDYLLMGNTEGNHDYSLTSNENLIGLLEEETEMYEVTQKDYQVYENIWNFSILKTQMGYVLYTLLLLGFSLSLGQGLIFIQISRDNSPFFGNLLTRGVSKKQIFRFGLSQILIFFLFAFSFAIITVIIPLIIALRVFPDNYIHEVYYIRNLESMIKYPIFFNWPLLALNLLTIIGGSLLLFIIFFKLQKRESFFIHTTQF